MTDSKRVRAILANSASLSACSSVEKTFAIGVSEDPVDCPSVMLGRLAVRYNVSVDILE